MPDGKALTVVNAVKTVITKFGVDINQVVGLGSDTSAMASELNGVNGLLKQENPSLVFSHCVAHRLGLGCPKRVPALHDARSCTDDQV